MYIGINDIDYIINTLKNERHCNNPLIKKMIDIKKRQATGW